MSFEKANKWLVELKIWSAGGRYCELEKDSFYKIYSMILLSVFILSQWNKYFQSLKRWLCDAINQWERRFTIDNPFNEYRQKNDVLPSQMIYFEK